MDNLTDKLASLAGEALYSSRIPQIEIRQSDGLRWMHFGDSAVQACMLLDNPHQLQLPYTQAMLAGLVFIEQPQRLLNLGLGGGSFIRFFEKTWPALAVESVDNSADVIALSREFFQVSERSPLHCMNAEAFVAAVEENYDAIFCDLYADNSHPTCMFDEQFYGNCCQSLTSQGMLTVNLLLTDEAEMINLLQTVRKHFPIVVLMGVPDHANTLLFALKQPVADSEFLMSRVQQLQADFQLDLMPYVEQFNILAAPVDEV